MASGDAVYTFILVDQLPLTGSLDTTFSTTSTKTENCLNRPKESRRICVYFCLLLEKIPLAICIPQSAY